MTEKILNLIARLSYRCSCCNSKKYDVSKKATMLRCKNCGNVELTDNFKGGKDYVKVWGREDFQFDD
jgi:uncharacterized Zn finger protein